MINWSKLSGNSGAIHLLQNNFTKINSLQLSLLDPEFIKKGAVCEIFNSETYESGEPKINGLFDPRMGVLDPGLICPTDGLDYMTDKVETVAKILTNHGVPTSVATSSSMDFADEYGFEKWDGAQKIWNAALNMVGYTIDEVY